MISYIKLFGIGVPQMIQGLSHIIENTGSFSISICYSQHVPSSTSDVLDLGHHTFRLCTCKAVLQGRVVRKLLSKISLFVREGCIFLENFHLHLIGQD